MTAQTPQQLLSEWTRALNAADVTALERLYADRVRFYGQSLSRAQVLESKRKALAATPGFTQSILGAPSVEQAGEVTRVAFHKRSGAKAKQHDVLATLVLSSTPPLLIQEESDAATDRRFRPSPAPAAAPEDCDSAVWFLVDSTREAQQLSAQIDQNLKGFPKSADLHSGGIGPFTPQETGDGTYQVELGVHHPDRFEAYAWFTLTAAGKLTVSAYTLNLDDAVVTAPAEALRHFQRLCVAK